MQLEQHMKLVGCDLDSDALSAAAPDFLLAFALRVLNWIFDSTEDKVVSAAARTFKEKTAVNFAFRK